MYGGCSQLVLTSLNSGNSLKRVSSEMLEVKDLGQDKDISRCRDYSVSFKRALEVPPGVHGYDNPNETAVLVKHSVIHIFTL